MSDLIPPSEVAEFIVADEAMNNRERAIGVLAAVVIGIHKAVWGSPNPQGVVDKFIKDGQPVAAQRFYEHAKSVELLLLLDPNSIPEEFRAVPADKLMTPNEDGSVTISDIS